MAAELEFALARITQWKTGLLQGLPEARATGEWELESVRRALERLATRLQTENLSDAARAAMRRALRDFQRELHETKALWAQWRDFDEASLDLLRNQPASYAAGGGYAADPSLKRGSRAWEG